MPKKNGMLKIWTLLLVAALLMTGCSRPEEKAPEPSEPSGYDENDLEKEAPISEPDGEEEQDEEALEQEMDFSLVDAEGNSYSLEDYRGRVVLLNFWGTWCRYCVEEMPLLNETYEQYQEELVILAVNDQGIPGEISVSGVMEWVAERAFTFPVLFDMDGSLARRFGVAGYPTTYVYDQEGVYLGRLQGMIDKKIMAQILSEIVLNEGD